MKIDNDLIANLRQDYISAPFDKEDVKNSPILQFKQWFKEALASNINEPNAMTLASVNAEGRPSARIVLLKGFDDNGFVFYTNYNSRKGQELQQNPYAALVFLWLDLHRQVRIEGTVEKLSPAASTQYFQSRPKGSQIGAWASSQSSVISDRNILEVNVEKLKQDYQDKEKLPRPEHWGGFRVKPTVIEFWQGRRSRLHDRIRYTVQENGSWIIERLAP